MSQAIFFDKSTILQDIETITGNIGGPVGPTPLGNLNLVGAGGVVVTGNPATNTLTITAAGGNISGSVITVGAVTGDAITFPLAAVVKVYSFEVRVVGYNGAGSAGCVYKLIGGCKTNGVAGTLIGSVDQTINEDAVLVVADATVVMSGNNLVVRVTGAPGLTINWSAAKQRVLSFLSPALAAEIIFLWQVCKS